jgi:hypothetical protein
MNNNWISTSCLSAALVATLAVVPASADSKAFKALELTIQPAATAASGGQRLPLRFTLHNTSDQTVQACLSPGRVVHLWGLDRHYAFTVAKQDATEPSCEVRIDLPPHTERSWTEEIAIPAVGASSAKIVGFAQIVQPGACDDGACEPLWLSAAFAPFKIETGAVQGTLDLRTGSELTAVATAAPAALTRGLSDSQP